MKAEERSKNEGTGRNREGSKSEERDRDRESGKSEGRDRNREGGAAVDAFARTCSRVVGTALDIAVFALAAVFPLFYRKAYYDIRVAKFQCYACLVGALLAFLLLFAIVSLCVDLKRYRGRHAKAFLARLRPANWRKTFCAADAALLAFWLSAGISTLLSGDIRLAFTGEGGCLSGFFVLTLYVISTLLIAHFWRPDRWHLETFLASGVLVCLIGITDYFQMDSLHFAANYGTTPTRYMYTSTMGHINIFTAYVGMVMGFAAAMFLLEENIWRRVWYYLCLTLSFAAIIMGSSDNAYISLAVVFALLPFAVIERGDGVTGYLLIAAAFLSVLQAVAVADRRFADVVLHRDGLFTAIESFGGLPYLAALSWVVAVASWAWHARRREGKGHAGTDGYPASRRKRRRLLWAAFLCLAALLCCLVLFDANAGGHAERYAAFRNYLVFSDSWGSKRGQLWREAVWLYGSYAPMRKLFGCGPDSLIPYVTNLNAAMGNKVEYLADNAHNALLQYLLTLGAAGMWAYVIFLFAAFRKLLRGWKREPYVLAAALSAACYVMQSAVNLNDLITMPVMWLMLGMGLAGCRRRED